MQEDSKVWDKDSVQALILANDKALAKALWNLYQRQTSAEQSMLQTVEHNGRGFNSRDAEFLSDVAKRLPAYGFNMTENQRAKIRPRMLKYWRQLLEEIEVKGGQVNYAVAKARKSEVAVSPQGEFAGPPTRGFPDLPEQWGAW